MPAFSVRAGYDNTQHVVSQLRVVLAEYESKKVAGQAMSKLLYAAAQSKLHAAPSLQTHKDIP
eukprot:m.372780 g.372780  ORF g.372780 m.372780 type:complete len:63 (-) comp64342_c0_seq1:3-191(-)